MELTQIQISKELRKELKSMKITKRETYDEILRRLLKKIRENEGTQE